MITIDSDIKKHTFSFLLYSVFFIFLSFFFVGRIYSYTGSIILMFSLFHFVYLLLGNTKSSVIKNNTLDPFFVLLFGYGLIAVFSELYAGSELSDFELHLKVLLACFIPLACTNLPIKFNNSFFIALSIMILTSLSIALWQHEVKDIERVSVKGFNAFSDIVSFFGVMFLAAIWLVFNKENKTIYSKSVKALIFIVLTLVFISSLYVTVLAANRGSWISIPFVLIIFSLAFFGFNVIKAALSLIALSTFMFLSYSFSDTVNLRVDQALNEVKLYSVGEGSGTSTGLRFEMWRFGIDSVADDLVLGLGVKGEREAKNNISNEYNSNIKDFSHLHNEFINILVFNGVFALLFYFLWLGYLAYFFMRSFYLIKSPLALAGFLGVVHYFFVSLVNVKLSYNVGVYAFIIVFSFIYGMVRNEMNNSISRRALNVDK